MHNKSLGYPMRYAYAQQWIEVALQFELPLSEKELEDWFMDTLQPMFMKEW